MKSIKPNLSFDIVKLVMAIIIISLHFDYNICPQGYLCVEGFFIIGGFLLMKTKINWQGRNFFDIFFGKLRKIYPIYFSVIFFTSLCLSNLINLDILIKSIFMIQGIGFAEAPIITMVPLWYVSVYIWMLFLFIAIIKSSCENRVYFICGVSSFICFSILYTTNPYHALNYSLEKFLLFPVGVYRGIASFSLGILLYPISSMVKDYLNKYKQMVCYTLVSILEIITLVGMIKIIFFSGIIVEYDFVFVVLFAVFILLLDLEKGVVYKAFSYIGLKVGKLSRVSYALYVYHYFIMILFKEKLIEVWSYIERTPFLFVVCVILSSITLEKIVYVFCIILRSIKKKYLIINKTSA